MDDCLRLLEKDDDGFSRWNAAQQLFVNVLNDWQIRYRDDSHDDNQQHAFMLDNKITAILSELMHDTRLDPHFLSLLLQLPNEAFLAAAQDTIDVEAIHYTRKYMRQQIATALKETFWSRYQQLNQQEPYTPDAVSIGRRCLKNTLLQYLMLLDETSIQQACLTQYQQSNNMTDTMAAFTAVVHSDFRSTCRD